MTSRASPTFGMLLKQYRVTAGLSQEALAEQAGISTRAVSDLERGLKQTPRRDTVDLLAAALGLAADERAAWEATVARRRGAQGGPSGAPASQSAAPASDVAALPVPLTPLLGRVQEVAALTALLHRDEVRLLTLVGPGGVGKTRLALAVGAAALGDYPAGVWLVELASVADPTLVPRSVAGALGLREEPHRSHLATLLDGLADRHVLLVLDNCEHLLAACANLVSGLLRACAALRVLATSRAGLGVRGEQLHRVPPLRVPSPHALPPLAHLGGYGAVSLFVTRAQARRRDFALSADTAPAVVEICRRLDGLPLAIELAAARIGSMAVAEIARRLEGSFGLLTGGPRDVAARQQTLRATLDWSWALLDTAEQALLGHLSVFAGGWTLDAAEAVCGGAGAEVLELLAGLVDVSLVELEESGGQARYRLLETVRQYAAERLAAEPASVRATVHRRHLNWCLALAEEADSRLFGPEQPLWGRRLEAEHDNLRAALAWSVQGAQQPDAGLRLASALGMFWAMRGHLAEGRRWLECALTTAPRSAALRPTRATALQRAGYLAYRQGDYQQAGAFYDQSTALARELGDQRSLAWALNGLGLVAWSLGDFGRATAVFADSLALWRAVGESHGLATALLNLGNVAASQGDYTQARALYEESLALERSVGNLFTQAIALRALGIVVQLQGDVPRAAALYRESLSLGRELGDTTEIAQALGNLAMAVYVLGDVAQAQALLEESLVLFRVVGDRQGLTRVLGDLATLAYDRSEDEQAVRLSTESLDLARRLGNQRSIASALLNLGRALYRSGDAPQALAVQREALVVTQAIGDRGLLAVGLERVATVCAGLGRTAQAARLLGAAEQGRETLGTALWGREREEHEQTMHAVRQAVDEQAFRAAWSEGRALLLEEAVTRALADHAAAEEGRGPSTVRTGTRHE